MGGIPWGNYNRISWKRVTDSRTYESQGGGPDGRAGAASDRTIGVPCIAIALGSELSWRPRIPSNSLGVMDRVLLDDVVRTDYGQFDVVWSGVGFDGDFDKYFHGQTNGIVGAASGDGVYINLARRSGGSRVRIALTEAEPPLPDDDFGDVVEVSVEVPAGAAVRWSSWAGESSGLLDGIEAGTYRVRVSARGRDEGRDGEFADEVVDEYFVELWPAPLTDDAVVRVGSDDARYWHSETGGRR